MPAPNGFAWSLRKNGDVIITHHGREAAVLRGRVATDFVDDVSGGDGSASQELMARLTGNYRRGNERRARR